MYQCFGNTGSDLLQGITNAFLYYMTWVSIWMTVLLLYTNLMNSIAGLLQRYGGNGKKFTYPPKNKNCAPFALYSLDCYLYLNNFLGSIVLIFYYYKQYFVTHSTQTRKWQVPLGAYIFDILPIFIWYYALNDYKTLIYKFAETFLGD